MDLFIVVALSIVPDEYLDKAHKAGLDQCETNHRNWPTAVRQLLIKKLMELVFCSTFGNDPLRTVARCDSMAAT
jgi:hypothetical protein